MGTQQFASGLSPIDDEKLTATRDNTQTLISRGNWVEKYKNQVNKAVATVSPGTTTILSIVGSGYLDMAIAKLSVGTPAMFHGFEIWLDGSKFFNGSWVNNTAYTGLATKENFFVDSSSYLALIDALHGTVSVGNNLNTIKNIVGPNNSYDSDGPMIRLSQPVFFNTSLQLKVYNNQATTDTVHWVFSGGVK